MLVEFTSRELDNLHHLLLVFGDIADNPDWREDEKADFGTIFKKVETAVKTGGDIISEVQTRNEKSELRFFSSLVEAFKHSEKDKTVWKISYDYAGERIRMVRTGKSSWSFQPIELDMEK